MPRRALKDAGGIVFHVLNRSARRTTLFHEPQDYIAFERALKVALHKFPIRLLAYCVMPNHWHLVVWPIRSEMPLFMHWLTLTHARYWHEVTGTQGEGHVYQDRYRAIPVQHDHHLRTLIRYVERNPLRANLVRRAEDWPWSSAFGDGDSCNLVPIAPWPIPRPDNWIDVLNEGQPGTEEGAVQDAIRQGRPLGEAGWTTAVALKVRIAARRPGRPSRT